MSLDFLDRDNSDALISLSDPVDVMAAPRVVVGDSALDVSGGSGEMSSPCSATLGNITESLLSSVSVLPSLAPFRSVVPDAQNVPLPLLRELVNGSADATDGFCLLPYLHV